MSISEIFHASFALSGLVCMMLGIFSLKRYLKSLF